jgi:hypothetical protein
MERIGPRSPLLLAGAGLLGLFIAAAVSAAARTGTRPADLHIFWLAGRAYLHGHSPYPSPAAVGHHGDLFVYPAAMAALFASIAWLPLWAATVIWTVGAAFAIVAALWLLGVRDSRCYAIAVVSYPVASSVTVGTLTPFLLLGVAALWRWRDDPRGAIPAACFLFVSKLFLWPLAVWLIATRRYATAAWSVGLGVAVSLAAWAPIRLQGLSTYPTLLHKLSLFEGPVSYQPVWLLPGSPTLLFAVLAMLSVAAAAGLILATPRLGDWNAFQWAIGLALVLSPILWAHYFLLLLPLLGASFSLGWVALLLFWASRSQASHGEPWRVLLFALVAIGALRLSDKKIAGGHRLLGSEVSSSSSF